MSARCHGTTSTRRARDNPLLQRFDFLFTNFSSAASYSGPAAIRVLRAACGQPEHKALYEPTPGRCHLFQALAHAGFSTRMLLNHDGHFDNFLKEVQKEIGVDGVAHRVRARGAALRGDGNQIAGMREIPTPRIINVPVGVKLVGLPRPNDRTVTIDAPTSYLGLSQLLST